MTSLLRLASTIACAILIISFGLFAIEQAKGGSKQEVAKLKGINEPNPSPETEREREKKHGKVREAIDDADDVLVKPFASTADGSSSSWVRRGVPTLLALLIYGLGLSFLARFARGRA